MPQSYHPSNTLFHSGDSDAERLTPQEAMELVIAQCWFEDNDYPTDDAYWTQEENDKLHNGMQAGIIVASRALELLTDGYDIERTIRQLTLRFGNSINPDEVEWFTCIVNALEEEDYTGLAI